MTSGVSLSVQVQESIAVHHDVELSLAAATTLVNTLPGASHSGDDELTTPEQLNAWFEDEGFTGDRLGTEEELESLRALRHRLRALWSAETDARPPSS